MQQRQQRKKSADELAVEAGVWAQIARLASAFPGKLPVATQEEWHRQLCLRVAADAISRAGMDSAVDYAINVLDPEQFMRIGYKGFRQLAERHTEAAAARSGQRRLQAPEPWHETQAGKPRALLDLVTKRLSGEITKEQFDHEAALLGAPGRMG